ncbi:MAG: hypothetical protein RXR09_07445 [Acidilobus sp.]
MSPSCDAPPPELLNAGPEGIRSHRPLSAGVSADLNAVLPAALSTSLTLAPASTRTPPLVR